jgi:hypothetical protein
MDRRAFILTAAGVGIASIGAYYLMRDVEYEPTLAIPRDLSLIWNPEKIREIGNQYRVNTPGEASVRPLVKLLNSAPPEQAIRNDFATGQTVIMDGWIISITEARQCALASTVSPN